MQIWAAREHTDKIEGRTPPRIAGYFMFEEAAKRFHDSLEGIMGQANNAGVVAIMVYASASDHFDWSEEDNEIQRITKEIADLEAQIKELRTRRIDLRRGLK